MVRSEPSADEAPSVAERASSGLAAGGEPVDALAVMAEVVAPEAAAATEVLLCPSLLIISKRLHLCFVNLTGSSGAPDLRNPSRNQRAGDG
ncbi:hypothetical protein GUJ93_ZPchr0003g18209 [Zizania palustris]|uniref:Uncharacterized protein n=1 Tax=Zizania palustris TaxID=103762 RepID=A0A8J5VUY0_ZIZPA|nr:hypothetical protein GUJ93_ZPchr0003g18209 [Zizania palustris]